MTADTRLVPASVFDSPNSPIPELPLLSNGRYHVMVTHSGRGGWTWSTGSAGWWHGLIVELLLGLKREASRLHITPCMPAD